MSRKASRNSRRNRKLRREKEEAIKKGISKPGGWQHALWDFANRFRPNRAPLFFTDDKKKKGDFPHYPVDTILGHHYNNAFGGVEYRKGGVHTISILHEDETENEFDVELCCETCASRYYGWTANQFNKVMCMTSGKEEIRIPSFVKDAREFKIYIRQNE